MVASYLFIARIRSSISVRNKFVSYKRSLNFVKEKPPSSRYFTQLRLWYSWHYTTWRLGTVTCAPREMTPLLSHIHTRNSERSISQLSSKFCVIRMNVLQKKTYTFATTIATCLPIFYEIWLLLSVWSRVVTLLNVLASTSLKVARDYFSLITSFKLLNNA